MNVASWFALSAFVLQVGMGAMPAQNADARAVVSMVDAAVAARYAHVAKFTAVERYNVYRGSDESNPAAVLVVRDEYTKGVGKSYTVLSQSGSAVIQKFGLETLLKNEQTVNQPGNVERSWFNSANYEMTLRPGTTVVDGRTCFAFEIKARRKASNTIDGAMWVDAKDGTLVKIDGIATQNASIFAGPTHMMRTYKNVNGYSMAAHARAETTSSVFGRTVVTVDYGDYVIQEAPGP